MITNGTTRSERQVKLFNLFMDLEVFRFGEFYLKSGQMTPIYIDLRRLISRPTVLRQAAEDMVKIIKEKDLKFDYIIGVPYAAIPLATLVSSILDVPMLMRRKEAKSHGTKQMVEGIYETGRRVLLVEDVVTHGDSIRETAEGLKDDGLEVFDSISILDRQQGGGEMLEKNGINYHSLLTMEIILDCLVEKNQITAERKTQIIEHLRKPF